MSYVNESLSRDIISIRKELDEAYAHIDDMDCIIKELKIDPENYKKKLTKEVTDFHKDMYFIPNFGQKKAGSSR